MLSPVLGAGDTDEQDTAWVLKAQHGLLQPHHSRALQSSHQRSQGCPALWGIWEGLSEEVTTMQEDEAFARAGKVGQGENSVCQGTEEDSASSSPQ